VADNQSERERRRYVRLELSENVRAFDDQGREMGKVEKVGAGGMQIRLGDDPREYQTGSTLAIRIVEPGDVENRVHVEVRVRDGDILGLRFLN
jgi:hypothetical protein